MAFDVVLINPGSAFNVNLSTSISTVIKYWDGLAWQEGTLKYWDGSAWTAAILKRWNGSTWETI